MTHAEVQVLLRELKLIFDVVRLVDVSMTTQYLLSETGEFVAQPYACYVVWNRDRRCENCISAKALCRKSTMTKFEFIDSDVYFVTAKYVEVEGVSYVLEMVTKVTDQTLFGAYGHSEFIQAIQAYNQKLYVDGLTGAYNRHYYEEQLSGLPKLCAVAMVDVDHFKELNDRYGHLAGDFVLQEIVKRTQALVAGLGAVVRFGGDEFLLTFQDISEETLPERLEAIRRAVSEIRMEEYPELRTTVSIGAVYCGGYAAARLEEADQALYRSKSQKNKVTVEVLRTETR